MSTQKFSTRYIVKIGIFSAIAFIIMFFEFPLPFFPTFLKFDFSDSVALVGGVSLGPLAAVLIQLLKNVLHLILRNETGGIGELSNFIVGVALILPITYALKRKENNKNLLIGLIVGAVAMVAVAALGNYYIFLPAYIPDITAADRVDMIIKMLVPFNLVKATIEGVIIVIIFNGLKDVLKFIRN